MPRLPTIRVIGSQDISTRVRSSLSAGGLSTVAMFFSLFSLPGRTAARRALRVLSVAPRTVTGGQLRTPVTPAGLFVHSVVGEVPQRPDQPPVQAGDPRRELASRRLVHEGHELVREARHGATDADAADVGAAAEARHPASLGHVAVHHRPPATQLDQALGRAVLGGELALLVEAGPITPLVHGAPEEPGRSQLLVERDHRR